MKNAKVAFIAVIGYPCLKNPRSTTASDHSTNIKVAVHTCDVL